MGAFKTASLAVVPVVAANAQIREDRFFEGPCINGAEGTGVLLLIMYEGQYFQHLL
jgi:hypothetical protein